MKGLRIGLAVSGAAALLAGWLAAASLPAQDQEPRPAKEHPGLSGQRGGMQPPGRGAPSWEMLAKHLSPQEMEELRRLQDENPQAFRRKIHELWRRLRPPGEFAPRLKGLREAYLSAPDDATREQLRDQIAAAVKAEYAERMQAARERLEQSRARLAEIEQKYTEQEKNAGQIIADRIRELTSLEAKPAPAPPPPPE